MHILNNTASQTVPTHETTLPWDKLGEECGVVAIYRQGGDAAPLAHRALFALQHRGQEAAGIAVAPNPEQDIIHLRNRGLVADALPMFRVQELAGEHAIGHVRYSTVSADRAENIQPFLATTPYGRFAIAHNGNLNNAAEMNRKLEREGALMSTTMDTELMVHLLARSQKDTFIEGLRAAAKEIRGAYSLTMLCAGKLYGLRDPNGLRPLVLGRRCDGWVLASETCALEVVDAEYVREIAPGELIEIGADGPKSTQLLPAGRLAPCVFELVYFARPNSNVFGQVVHGARTRMGEELAKADMDADLRPDVVVPVPDSGIPAALGYARASGIPMEKAIIRSHFVGRTFMLPDQDARTHTLRLKLSVIQDAIKGKRVLLVDDSIVRGNTSRLIVKMVRDAGAKEVWMRIASPPLAWPCNLGIDTPTREELIINQLGSVTKIEKFLNADNLKYLSLDGLRQATGRGEFCMGCMDGEPPV